MDKMLEGRALMKSGALRPEVVKSDSDAALRQMMIQLGPYSESEIGQSLLTYCRSMGAMYGSPATEADIEGSRAAIQKGAITPLNEYARRLRTKWYDRDYLATNDMGFEALQKAQMDVGTLTNFANIVGGQSLGYVSMDTRLARSTIRPNSFTMYQALDKSLAWQVVDYWPQATQTGGAAPGSNFASFSSVSSGTLATNAGSYQLSNIQLKLALDGRAITTALASQNSFVNVQEQESINAALSILGSLDWACYWGNSTSFPNMFDGLYTSINSNAPNNIFDFYRFSAQTSSRNWTPETTLYNMIYESAAQITSYGVFGHITHAFMSPTAMGSFQSVTNAVLNNILNQLTEMQDRNPIMINGNLVGMQTRVGNIQFPQDLLIDARMQPLQAINSALATASAPTPPTSATATIVTGASAAGTNFNGSYTPAGGGSYQYAVAATTDSFAESTLTASAVVTGVTSGVAVQVAIAPAASGADCTGFRVYRSGLAPVTAKSTGAITTAADANGFRYIGFIRSNGASTVNFIDLNGGGGTFIPGSTAIFLTDMDDQDFALDYRILLPLVKIELFAANLFMPWAVASIGAVRNRIPQFHGVIKNYVPINPLWNPLVSSY